MVGSVPKNLIEPASQKIKHEHTSEKITRAKLFEIQGGFGQDD